MNDAKLEIEAIKNTIEKQKSAWVDSNNDWDEKLKKLKEYKVRIEAKKSEISVLNWTDPGIIEKL